MPQRPEPPPLPDALAAGRSPLVGRERERDALRGRMAEAAAGRGSVVLVAGEPGAGKTRLLEGLAEDASAAGATVLRGGASDLSGMPLYLPFVEALGRHLRAAPLDAVRRQFGPVAATLAAIVPEVAERLGGAPSGIPLPPEQERFRLFEAVGDALEGMAADAPLLLVLDDLHWADPSTLDLLCAVGRRVRACRVLIAGAYREGDAAQNPAFGRAFAELSRQRALWLIPAGPLAAPAIVALAEGLLGAALAEDAAALLADRSEGNPFFAEEVLRGWLETGGLQESAGDAPIRLAEPAPTAVPGTIRAAVGQRLARLSPDTAGLLGAAAAVGRRIDPGVLARVVDGDPEEVDARLSEAARAGVLRATETGGFAFGHDVIRECLYAELPPTRRRRLHGAIGRALEAGDGEWPAPAPAEVAFHYARGGDRERAVAWSRRAAAQALAASAPRAAMAHWHTALDLGGDADPARGDLLLALGEAALLADDDGATAAFASAEAWFRDRRRREAAARAALGLGRAHWRRERIADARAAFESALALLDGAAVAVRVSALVDLGTLLCVSLHAHDEGIALVRQATELAAEAAEPRLVAAATRALGNLLVRRGDLPGGIALLEAALRLAEAEDDPVEAAECCACLAPAWYWLGSVGQSAAVTRRRLAHARRANDPFQLRHVHTWLAICDAIRGRLAAAAAELDRAEAIVGRLGSPEPAAFLRFARGGLASFQGDHARAEALMGEAVAAFRGIGPGALVWYLGWLGIVHAARGKVAEARAVMEELEGLVAALPGPQPPGEPLAYLVQLALALDDRERLARYAALLNPLAGRFHDALVDRLRGEVAARLGNGAAAERLLAGAEAVARREPLPWELARVLAARADLQIADGPAGAATARAMLAEAAEHLDRCGNRDEAERLRARARAAGAERANRTDPATLSPREVEVLRLVAAGKGNRDIAAALFISEKTVEHHLSRIYARIGVENRAAAAAYALRHGIA